MRWMYNRYVTIDAGTPYRNTPAASSQWQFGPFGLAYDGCMRRIYFVAALYTASFPCSELERITSTRRFPRQWRYSPEAVKRTVVLGHDITTRFGLILYTKSL